MSKHKFINGLGNGRFGPKENCTREMALAVAVILYEKFTGISN